METFDLRRALDVTGVEILSERPRKSGWYIVLQGFPSDVQDVYVRVSGVAKPDEDELKKIIKSLLLSGDHNGRSAMLQYFWDSVDLKNITDEQRWAIGNLDEDEVWNLVRWVSHLIREKADRKTIDISPENPPMIEEHPE